MLWIKNNYKGFLLCLPITAAAWLLGRMFPLVGGPIFAIVIGMIVTLMIKDKIDFSKGTGFISKYVLQFAVELLGFGLDLNVILRTGRQSLPIIVTTISVSLLIAFFLHKAMKIEDNTSVLIGVGSSICGGSAIAAAAPVVKASDTEVAQSISVIFFFNMLAAICFPLLGTFIGFSHDSGYNFGVFAGTAVNDTSSVTATAATWDSMWNLGSQTLDTAVTVKLTRTLAIIPIVLVLGLIRAGREKKKGTHVRIKNVFPVFILCFVMASAVTTAATGMFGISAAVFLPLKELSKLCIVFAMAAIGLNTNVVQLVHKGGKSLLLGACCWIGITVMSLLMQHIMGLI